MRPTAKNCEAIIRSFGIEDYEIGKTKVRFLALLFKITVFFLAYIVDFAHKTLFSDHSMTFKKKVSSFYKLFLMFEKKIA